MSRPSPHRDVEARHLRQIEAVTLNMTESDQVAPRARTLQAIRGVLEDEGVRFIGSETDGFGVLPSLSGVAWVLLRDSASPSRRSALRNRQPRAEPARVS